MIGASTKITKAQRKNAISKICTSFDNYFTALCIKTKNKPDITIRLIDINGFGNLLTNLFNIPEKYTNHPSLLN